MTEEVRKRRSQRPKRLVSSLSARTLGVMDETRSAIRIADDGALVPPAEPLDPQHGFLKIRVNGGAETVAQRLEKIARSVGRIDFDGNGVGTGILVGEKLVLTAGHVVGLLESKSDNLFADGRSSIDFEPKPGNSATQRFRITGAVAPGPYALFKAGADGADLMLLELENAPDVEIVHPNLRFRIDSISNPAAAVIGYPAFSTDNDPNAMRAIVSTFGDNGDDCYSRKCIGIHSLSTRRGEQSFSRLYYDHRVPTMPQCSGGPLIELNTCSLVGIHTAGEHLVVNIAQNLTATVRNLQDDPVALRLSEL